jgi:predicted phosphodiesterase
MGAMATEVGPRFHVLHDISELAVEPVPAGIAAVVFGHSHKPSIEMRNGVLYLNPGSAGAAAVPVAGHDCPDACFRRSNLNRS